MFPSNVNDQGLVLARRHSLIPILIMHVPSSVVSSSDWRSAAGGSNSSRCSETCLRKFCTLALRAILANASIEAELTQLVRGLLLQRRGIRQQQVVLALSVAYMSQGQYC